MRSILIRLAIPTLLAVVFLAYFGVPVADRLLEDWFRADIDMRAQLLAKSISASIGPLIDKDQPKELGKFLAGITADERLVAVVLCRADGSLLLKTDRTPKSISCPDEQAAGKHTDRLVQLPSGSVEVSAFPVATAGGNAIDILIIHDLQFIDRRQSTARNYVLASAVLFATLLALVVGFIFWLLLRRWVRVLVGDIRGLRFLDDAHSESESSPILSQVRAALRDLEANQRLEIDFHENWTPHALQQVVREHLHEPEVFVVSNREPYIHNETDQGVVVQVPASGMVTALEPIVRACSGTWIAHGSGTADRRTVDRHDHIKVPPEDPSYTLRRVWLNEAEESGFYYGFSKGCGRYAIWSTFGRLFGNRTGANIRPSTSASPGWSRASPRPAIRWFSSRISISRSCPGSSGSSSTRRRSCSSGTFPGPTRRRSACALGSRKFSRTCSLRTFSDFTPGIIARISWQPSTDSSNARSTTNS